MAETFENINDIYRFFDENDYMHDVISDGVTTVNGSLYSVYRAVVIIEGKKYYGVGQGKPEDALFNSFVPILNKIGLSAKRKETVSETSYNSTNEFIIEYGKYRGRTLNQVPIDFIKHWARQEKNGSELDVMIKKCAEYCKENNIDITTPKIEVVENQKDNISVSNHTNTGDTNISEKISDPEHIEDPMARFI